MAGFFSPWIAGSGSLAKPLDDGTSSLQKGEPTGLFKAIIKTAKGTLDIATSIVSPIDLDRELKGYEIPIAEETEGLKPRIYLIYILPLMAAKCLISVFKRRQRLLGKLLTFFIVTIIAVFMFLQVEILSREGVFVETTPLYGFFLTLYGYIALSALCFFKVFDSAGSKPRKSKIRL